MKVIVANYRYFVAGGPEKYMFKFMDAARARNIEVIPFSVSNPRNVETPYISYFAKPRSDALMYADTKRSLRNLIGMFRATVYNWDAEKQLRRLIRDTKPDAVYILHEVNHLSPSIIRAAKKENVRVVHRISDFFMMCAKYDFLCGNEICEACIHGDYTRALKCRCVKGSASATMLRIFAMKLYRWMGIFNDVDHYITTCDFTRNKLIESGLDGERITTVSTFIDAGQITPSYENDHYFLFLGRKAHQKGTIYAIQAMSYLKDTDYVLKITGTPSEESEEDQELERYIRENGLEDKIVFTGFQTGDALKQLISRSTAIVCPAIWYENMPNTVIEAYAYGKPVIASKIGSLAEIVEDGQTGLLFEMKNAKELSEKMRAFVENQALGTELGKTARRRCEEAYCENTHMNRVLEILNGSR